MSSRLNNGIRGHNCMGGRRVRAVRCTAAAAAAAAAAVDSSGRRTALSGAGSGSRLPPRYAARPRRRSIGASARRHCCRRRHRHTGRTVRRATPTAPSGTARPRARGHASALRAMSAPLLLALAVAFLPHTNHAA
ncbi:hypothetical protein EVAR_100999_1 [Eumeta japonica]|uniref:Uncharacterized protein n=1 Tax=Eumeta variegata TaxID=151549 RepID=A0A4C2AEC0_EUMVA|nr:hypothetical protein EVAR_100999_1 [Eumeta japonica]